MGSNSGPKGGKYYASQTDIYGDVTLKEWAESTEKNIWLDIGGKITLKYIPPEDDDDPWNNDDPPMGPQAA